MSEKRIFERSQWIEPPVLFPIGGRWVVAVGKIRDSSGVEKVRIAKGQIKGITKRTSRGLECLPEDPLDPVKLQNKINIKTLHELEFIYTEVKKLLEPVKISEEV